MLNRRFGEEWSVIGTIDPASYTASPASTTLTDAIDMSDYHEVAFILATGAIAAAATRINFSVTQAVTSGGAYKAISGSAITQMTGSPTDNNEQVIVTITPESLDLANGYRYIKGSLALTNGTSTTYATVIALGRAKLKPADDLNLASVVEIINK